jgi:hypothetical protein
MFKVLKERKGNNSKIRHGRFTVLVRELYFHRNLVIPTVQNYGLNANVVLL